MALTFDSRSMLELMVLENEGLGITSRLAAEASPYFKSGAFRLIDILDYPTEIVHYMAYLADMQATDVEADIIQNIENYYDTYKRSHCV